MTKNLVLKVWYLRIYICGIKKYIAYSDIYIYIYIYIKHTSYLSYTHFKSKISYQQRYLKEIFSLFKKIESAPYRSTSFSVLCFFLVLFLFIQKKGYRCYHDVFVHGRHIEKYLFENLNWFCFRSFCCMSLGIGHGNKVLCDCSKKKNCYSCMEFVSVSP